jgi:carbon monoxide dehydrogenase subunit G
VDGRDKPGHDELGCCAKPIGSHASGAFDLQQGMRFSLDPTQGTAYPMNVSGEFTVNAPRDVVFKTLRDPSSFVRFVDGVSDLKEIDPTHYAAVFETKVAYLKFKFNVTVEVTRAEEPSAIEAKIEGNPLGVVGRLTAKSITRLEEAGNETKVTYSVESTLAGKLGSIGQPVLRSKAKDMEKIFAQRLRAAFTQNSPTPVSPETR